MVKVASSFIFEGFETPPIKGGITNFLEKIDIRGDK
jgi:hypothetical protein